MFSVAQGAIPRLVLTQEYVDLPILGAPVLPSNAFFCGQLPQFPRLAQHQHDLSAHRLTAHLFYHRAVYFRYLFVSPGPPGN